LLIQIATIALLYAAAFSLNVAYIQSIGSGIGNFSGLFHITLLSSLLPVKPCNLTQKEQDSFLLSEELKQKLGFGNEISDTWFQWFIGFAEPKRNSRAWRIMQA